MSAGDVIKWRAWGTEVFNESRSSNRPVLLAIGATWCHWCHVMDEKTYSDPEVIRTVNQGFIPVRVDTDRQPEVNRRYNMGGWPTTAFLNSEGAVLTGFTYMPAEEFRRVLRDVSRIYGESPGIRNVSVLDTGDQGYYEVPPLEGPVDFQIIERFRGVVERSFDRRYGGFGMQPKFPHAEALDFALEMHVRTGSDDLLEIVTRTLDGMASGGMYDHAMGGFFRYSTTRDWSIPHFEKMLEDNAKLLLTYASAYKVTGREEYRKTCREVVDYLNSALWREAGGYYGSQDADEEYYRLSLEERRARTPPRVDRAVYVNWNALAVSSLVRASRYLAEPSFMERSGAVLDTLLEEGYREGEGMCHYLDDAGSHGGGLFEDQIETCWALLEAGASRAFPRAEGDYAHVAADLLQICFEKYWDREDGAFCDISADTRESGDAAGALKRPMKSLEQNARAAEVLRRAGVLSESVPQLQDLKLPGFRTYADAAGRCLRAFAGSYEDHGLVAAQYAIAVLHYLYPVRVEVAGAKNDDSTRVALERLGSVFFPGTDLSYSGRQEEGQDGPVIRVCAGTTCLPPAYGIEEAMRSIGEAYSLRFLSAQPRLPVQEEPQRSRGDQEEDRV